MMHEKSRKNTNIDAENNSTLSEEESHVTSQIKRGRKPISGRHIELTATLFPELGNRRHRPLERGRIEGYPITHPSEVRQVKSDGPQLRELPRRKISPENRQSAGGSFLLPIEGGEEERQTDGGQESLMNGEESGGEGHPAAAVVVVVVVGGAQRGPPSPPTARWGRRGR
ncbi:monogalactosyl diacylglycerol synthase 1 [Striga asiatica]|uniref:Monogalactosyl diacylglycerol synthase 1 n=1 Tax=Striga asiatica TaxID=4170 RepID=A0A5A7Q909_STRAF|nr:monogalactosyl diacylglycerol synthase 1 [Striga asiatica]